MTAIRVSPRELSGAQKSAIVCMTLGPQQASRILQQLTSEEIEQVTREIAAMPAVPPETVNAVLQEFSTVSHAMDSAARGGLDFARELLEQALGSTRARQVLDRLQGPGPDSGLKRLKKAAPEVLAGILRGEHPQTVALILAHVDSRQAAGVVQAMDPEFAADVLYRMARMEKISADVLALVETGLSSKTDLTLTQEMALSGGPAAVAKLLNLTGGTLEKQLLDGIETHGGEIASRIKALMFVFEDLLLLDGRSMQRLLRDVESKQLALALKAASEELKRHIMKNMSERAASALEEEIELLGAVRVREVEAAHAEVIERVRALEEAGEILVRSRGGNDDIIA
ncbi:MAG: flagellar motor switch protein FliG [Gemmatimonadales bacterium]